MTLLQDEKLELLPVTVQWPASPWVCQRTQLFTTLENLPAVDFLPIAEIRIV